MQKYLRAEARQVVFDEKRTSMDELKIAIMRQGFSFHAPHALVLTD